MSRWHRENPELYEQGYGPPDPRERWDRIRKEQKEGGIFLDGTGITPGTEKCRCGPDCEFPCWQRLGIADPCPECGCSK